MALPTNLDATYADSGSDASVKLHQQYHDTIHAAVNGLPKASGVAGTGMVPAASAAPVYGPSTTAATADGGRHTRHSHFALTDFAAVRLIFGNFQMANAVPGEAVGANPITVRASIEDTGGITGVFKYVSASTAYASGTTYVTGDMVTSGGLTYVSIANGNVGHTPSTSPTWWRQVVYYPVHFRGESSTLDVTIQPGQVVISDPVQLTPGLAKGGVFYTNTLVQPNNGTANTGSYPAGTWSGSTSGNVVGGGSWQKASATGSAPTDYTQSAPTTDTSDVISSAHQVYSPLGIIATPKVGAGNLPVVFGSGDSYFAGTGDGTNLLNNEFSSWFTRLLSDNATTPTQLLYPYVIGTKVSGRAQYDLGPGFTNRLMLAAGCTHFVDERGINDIAAAVTLATLQANALARWSTLQNLGLKVIACTIPPETTSTDSFATANNQTPKSGFGNSSVWSSYNAWLLTFPHTALTAIIDVSSVVTVTNGSGNPVWAPSLSNLDGIHPNTAGHVAIASTANVYYATAPSTPVAITAAGLFGTAA